MSRYLQSCQSPFWQAVFQKEIDYLEDALTGCEKILSVGCGPAIIEAVLQEKGFCLVGLDVSKEALQGVPDSLRTVVGSAEHMDAFEDSGFDAVIYVASLQFIEPYKQALAETARVLKPDGKFIALLLNPESHFFQQKAKDEQSYVNKIKHTDLKEMEQAVAKHFTFRAEYYLGIRDSEIFETRSQEWASLYIINGKKKSGDG
jgi:ubiquinone/menaquinone biosynthesis C-methylase UbiE